MDSQMECVKVFIRSFLRWLLDLQKRFSQTKRVYLKNK